MSALEQQQQQQYFPEEEERNEPRPSMTARPTFPTLSTASLRIQPPKFPHKAQNPGHEYVGKAPFRQAYVGPSGTGKSVLLNHNMNNFFGRFFQRIYILSPTFSTDPSFQPRNWEPTQVFSHWDVSILKDILRLQRQRHREKHGKTKPKRKRKRRAAKRARKIRLREDRAQRNEWSRRLEYREPTSQFDSGGEDDEEEKSEEDSDAETELKVEPNGEHCLVIIDDFAHVKDLMQNPILESFAFSGRHFDISVIVLSQKYSKLSTALRANLTEIAMFRPNGNEGEAFIDDHGTMLVTRREFRRMFAWAVSKHRHNFLWVMKQVDDMHTAYRLGLDKIIRIPFEELSGEEKQELKSSRGGSNENPSAERAESIAKRTERVEDGGSDPLHAQITQPDFKEVKTT